MKVLGIDPGSVRTGYGCIETDGTRHRLITCGAVSTASAASLPDRLRVIYQGLRDLIATVGPECAVVENLFHARNVRSALVLGHARGVAMLAAVEAGLPVFEYTPREIKQAVVGYGAAEKAQLQHMVKLLLGLDEAPKPHDAADALAAAICHVHKHGAITGAPAPRTPRRQRSWRHTRVPQRRQLS